MDFFNRMVEQFIRANRRIKKWKRAVSLLAAVVVFVTTYAMVLPAITLDKETATTQSGIEIAASDNETDSSGTVYEAEPEEEPVEEPQEEESEEQQEPQEESGEPQDEEPVAEDSGSESGSQDAEVSEEDVSGGDAEADHGQNTEEQADSEEAEIVSGDEDTVPDGEEDSASTAETLAEGETVEEIKLITEETQLIYEYIDEEYENGIEDENDDGIDDGYLVYAEFGEDAKLPEGVELIAEEITKESDPGTYEAYYEKALSGLQDKYDENTELSFARFYDIKFVYNGEEVEPSGDVKVRIEYKNAVEIEEETNVDAVHFDKNNDEEPEVIDSEVNKSEAKVEDNGEDDIVKTVEFESAQFSVYGIIGSYTVDFHWEVDGNVYEYSLAGGDSVSFRELVEMLHVIDGDTTEFICDISDIRFSDDSLVKVAQVTEGITAGALKEKLGLECEYSAELTEAEREAMDSKAFYPADWALISLKAFDTEEYLTVEMKTGESFRIKVTDAQIKKTVIGDSGDTWEITVTYDESAEIPDGSDLNVEEIDSGSAEYGKYLTDSAKKLGVKDSEVSFARFFDIEIIDQIGEKIEPKSPVEVKIAYKDAVEISEGETLSVVHFADTGVQLISNLETSEDQKEISYIQDSFSVTGTIVGTPENGHLYAVLVEYNGNYYSIQNDGSLKKVNYTGEGPLEVGATNPLDNPQMWTYENNNLYHNYREVGFNGGESASDFYRRYLDPAQDNALKDEDSGNTPDNGAPSRIGNGPQVTSRPVADQTKVSYTNGHIKQQNGNYYLGVKQNGNDISVIGQCDEHYAAKIILAEVTTLPTSNLHNEHAVQHIDISIEGAATVNLPLAYGTYYGPEGKNGDPVLIVDNDNKKSLELSETVPVTAQDIKDANIKAYIKNDAGNKVELPDAFYVTGYSYNAEAGESTEQVRIDGIFRVANMEPYVTTTHTEYPYGPWWPVEVEDDPITNHPDLMAERLEKRVYYTISTTKEVDFPLWYNGQPLCDENGEQIIRKVTVTLSSSFDYWDENNECPPLQERYKDLNGGWVENAWDHSLWPQGYIPSHDMSGMDFALGAGPESTVEHVAIEINKHLLNDEGDHITPGDTKTYSFNVYQGNESPNTFRDLDVNEYTQEPNYESYTEIHQKEVMVGDGGYGVTFDYDVAPGSLYVEENKASVDDIIVDKNGDIWYYDHTDIQTEYVWRKNGDDTKVHVSDKFTSSSEALKSIPEYLGPYISDEWWTETKEFNTQADAIAFRDSLNTKIGNNEPIFNGEPYSQHYNSVSNVSSIQKVVEGENVTRWTVSYRTNDSFNGFLEFDVYNVYKPVDSFKVEVEKEWVNDNPVNDAEINITLGRYKLVKDGSQVAGTGNLIIQDSYSGLGSGSNYRAVYTVEGENYSNTFRGDGTDVTIESLTPGTYTVKKTVTEVEGYSVNAVETEPISVVIPENGNGTAILTESVFTRTGAASYHVRVHWADGDYNWVDSNYPADSVLNFNLGVPGWMTDNGTFSYSMNGGSSFTDIGAGESLSIPFTLNRDYDIQIRYTKKAQDWGPTWDGWLNGPTITGAEPVRSRSGAPLRVSKSGEVNSQGSVTLTQTDPALPAAPEGFHYEVDTAYAQKPHTFKLTNGSWTASASGLEIGDANGEYVYYIASVTETGLPKETVATLIDEVSTNSSAKVLTITNNVPLTVDVVIKKTDDAENSTNYLEGAVFKLLYRTNSDEEFVNVSGEVVAELDSNSEFVVPKTGITLTGLVDGQYQLQEISSPAGYVFTDPSPVTFTVSEGAITGTEGTITGVRYNAATATSDAEFIIPNTPGAALPNTGGPGTGLFTILGSILIAGAGMLLWRRWRTV